jgi:hypothetical protein
MVTKFARATERDLCVADGESWGFMAQTRVSHRGHVGHVLYVNSSFLLPGPSLSRDLPLITKATN